MSPQEISETIINTFTYCINTINPFIYDEGIFSIFGSYLRSQDAYRKIEDIDILLILYAREYPRPSLNKDHLISKYVSILNCIANRLKQELGVWVYQNIFLRLLAPPSTVIKVHLLYYPTLLDALSVENPLLLRYILTSIKPILRDSINTYFDNIVENMPSIFKSISLEEMYLRFIRMRAIALLNTIVLNNLLIEKTKTLAVEILKLALKYYTNACKYISDLLPLGYVIDQVELSYDLILKIIKDILVNTEIAIEKLST